MQGTTNTNPKKKKYSKLHQDTENQDIEIFLLYSNRDRKEKVKSFYII